MAVEPYAGKDPRLTSLHDRVSKADAEIEKEKGKRPAGKPDAETVAKAADFRSQLAEAMRRQPQKS